MPPSMLEQLAYHANASVREAVADNINTPIDTLWVLANDDCPDVRYAIAENHNIPLAILSALMSDENPYVAHRARTTFDRLTGGIVLQAHRWANSDDERAVG